MPKQIEVLAEDISRDEMGRPTELYGTTRILTYKSFLFLNANPDNLRYKILYQVDENGNEVPGSPNLEAQHRVQLPQRNVVPVVDSGPSEREKQLLARIAELEKSNLVTVTLDGKPITTSATTVQDSKMTQVVTEQVQQPKKRGPKPKALQDVTEEVA